MGFLFTGIIDLRAGLFLLHEVAKWIPNDPQARRMGGLSTPGRMARGHWTLFILSDQGLGLVVLGVRRTWDDSLKANYWLSSGSAHRPDIPYFWSPQAPIAQRLEQGTHNPLVAGSNPAGRTKPSSVMVGVFSLIISSLQFNLYKKQLVSNTPKVVHSRLQFGLQLVILDCFWTAIQTAKHQKPP